MIGSQPTWQTRPVMSAIKAVANHKRITPKFLHTNRKSRIREAKDLRFLVWWLARQRGASFQHIGFHAGGFDHTTVRHGCRRMEAMRAVDHECRQLGDELLAKLEGRS